MEGTFSSNENAMSDTISNPNPSHWNALRKIVKQLPTNLAYYGSALGAIVLARGGELPPGLEFVAGSIGGNMLSNMIADILKGEDLLDDEIRQCAEEAINKSDIANLLTKQDFLQGYARLIQRLDTQKTISQDILDELQTGFSKVATADQVEELKRLIMQLMQQPSHSVARKARLFISYARADDEPFVERLYHDLKDEFDVWWDRKKMPNRGLTFLQEIREAVDWADRLLLVAGPHAFTSDYVRDEWQYAYETYKGINIALRLGDYTDFPAQLGGFDAPDFRDDTDYAERLVTLKRQLAEPIEPIGAFHNVPALPPHFLNRPEALDALRELVIADVDKPTLISAEKRTTAVEGMGGIGKSALAAAFAHDRKVRFAFPDGIIWLTVGHTPSTYELYRAVGVALGDDLSNYPDETIARLNAQKALAGKKCLLILDDVWELPVGRAFRDLISGTVARLLITTRNLQINDVLNVNEYRLNLIDESQAVDYLRSWAGDDLKLKEIAEQLGYLFLALKLAGARMKKDSLSGADYLHTFDRVSRMKIDRNATDRDDSLEVSIMLSVDAAFAGIEDARLLYHTFGIFQEDTPIPQQTILQLWQYLRPDVDKFDLSELLIALVDLALVERHYDQTITLHDLLHSYAREKLGDRTVQTHRDLLDSYGIIQWHTLPLDEPYLWHRIAYHLSKSERAENLYHLLTDTPDWMEAKLTALGSYVSFVSDLDLCLLYYDGNTSDEIVRVATLWAVRQLIDIEIIAYTDKLLSAMVWIDKNIEHNGYRTQQALNIVRLRSYAINKFDGLGTIFQVLRDTGDFRPDILNEAYAVATHQIDEKSFKVSALSFLAGEMYGYDKQLALKLFQQAHDVISSIPYENDKAFAMYILAGRLAQSGDYEQALNLTKNIPETFWNVNALVSIAETLFETNFGYAANLIEKALEIVSDLESVKHQQELFGDIGVTVAQSGNQLLTRRIVSVVVEDDQKALILCELASAISQVKNQGVDKDFNEIQLIISKIEDTVKRDTCLVKFVEALALNGRHDRSFQVASDIANAEKRSDALVNIVGSLRCHWEWSQCTKLPESKTPPRSRGFRQTFEIKPI